MQHDSIHNRTLGAQGEALASEYLEQQGFRIITRNWRCRHGELDLIALERGTLVAIEVKTRSGTGYGSPLEAITARKASRLRRLLQEWRRAGDLAHARMRIDAVGIILRDGDAPRIDHLRGIA